MAHRTQITLTDEQYARLRAESASTGSSIAELIRRAVEQKYGALTIEEKLAALDASFGAWSEEPGEDRAAYLADLRGPGLGHRLERDDALDRAS